MTGHEPLAEEWVGWGRPAKASKKAAWHLWALSAAGKATVCKRMRDAEPPKRVRTHMPKGRTCSLCAVKWAEAIGAITGKCVYCRGTVVPVVHEKGVVDKRVRQRHVPLEGFVDTITCIDCRNIDAAPGEGAPTIDEAELVRRARARKAARNLLPDSGVVLP